MENKNSKIYMVYQMSTEYSKTISMLDEVIKQQTLLINVVNKSKEKVLETFATGLQKDIEDKKESIKKLNGRLEATKKIIARYEKQDDDSKLVEEIVSQLLDSMGVANNEKSQEKNPSDKK